MILTPAALEPIAQLPTPVPADSEKVAGAQYAIRQGLRMLDMQSVAVKVTWAQFYVAGLTWEQCVKLVPFTIVSAAMQDVDEIIGPLATDPVPRRVLGCLRAQLDALAVDWLVQASAASVNTQATIFAQGAIDQAKRIQERKRPVEEETEKSSDYSLSRLSLRQGSIHSSVSP